MMWYWGSSYPWEMAILGLLMMLVVGGGVVASIVFVVRSLTHTSAPSDNALETLRKRLASGEINPDEFERIRKALQS